MNLAGLQRPRLHSVVELAQLQALVHQIHDHLVGPPQGRRLELHLLRAVRAHRDHRGVGAQPGGPHQGGPARSDRDHHLGVPNRFLHGRRGRGSVSQNPNHVVGEGLRLLDGPAPHAGRGPARYPGQRPGLEAGLDAGAHERHRCRLRRGEEAGGEGARRPRAELRQVAPVVENAEGEARRRVEDQEEPRAGGQAPLRVAVEARGDLQSEDRSAPDPGSLGVDLPRHLGELHPQRRRKDHLTASQGAEGPLHGLQRPVLVDAAADHVGGDHTHARAHSISHFVDAVLHPSRVSAPGPGRGRRRVELRPATPDRAPALETRLPYY